MRNAARSHQARVQAKDLSWIQGRLWLPRRRAPRAATGRWPTAPPMGRKRAHPSSSSDKPQTMFTSSRSSLANFQELHACTRVSSLQAVPSPSECVFRFAASAASIPRSVLSYLSPPTETAYPLRQLRNPPSKEDPLLLSARENAGKGPSRAWTLIVLHNMLGVKVAGVRANNSSSLDVSGRHPALGSKFSNPSRLWSPRATERKEQRKKQACAPKQRGHPKPSLS